MKKFGLECKNDNLKDGWYNAKFVNCKETGTKDTKWGKLDTGILYFKLDDGTKISQYTYLVGWKKLLPAKLVKAINPNAKEFDLERLIGKKVGIEVENKIDLDRVYTCVVDIVSAEEVKEKIKEESANELYPEFDVSQDGDMKF